MSVQLSAMAAGLLVLLAVGDVLAQGSVVLRDEAQVRGAVLRWNHIAIDASGLDHTPVRPGESRVFGEQIGPGRSSRAMAITHVAMLEAVNAAVPVFRSYVPVERPAREVNLSAAVAQAAHDALAAVFPSQTASFDAHLADHLRGIAPGGALDDGRELGRRAARAILEKSATDGATHAEPRLGVDHVTSDAPGHWRQDPVSLIPTALGAHWGSVRPFVLERPEQFRVPPPPAMTSDAYAVAFEEVRAYGGDGVTTPTLRTREENEIGIYWAYDGLPSLCAPPTLYNQLALTIANTRGTGALGLLRLLALINVAMSDEGIAGWESKYFYDVWRPVTGVREADAGTGPTRAGDGKSATRGDATFMPLGAPSSNLAGPNFTPPFPAYPSGHAGFGGALFQVLRRFYGRDDMAFTFVSDEYNGQTVDNQGVVRPLLPRRFTSLSQAEEENGQSRIYLGIHWAFDKTAGIAQGRRVGDFVFDRLYVPVR